MEEQSVGRAELLSFSFMFPTSTRRLFESNPQVQGKWYWKKMTVPVINRVKSGSLNNYQVLTVK